MVLQLLQAKLEKMDKAESIIDILVRALRLRQNKLCQGGKIRFTSQLQGSLSQQLTPLEWACDKAAGGACGTGDCLPHSSQ